jgi:hypothetical protein
MELQEYIQKTDNYLQEFKGQKIYVQKNGGLALLKMYRNRGYDFENNPWLRYCRGAIVDLATNKLICVPPMKSEKVENINDLTDNDDITYENLLEGTMINMFYHNNEWNISTRSSIGCKNSWDGKVSFLDMFREVSNDIQHYKDLKKNHCYSFVLQHKRNRIVSPVFENRIVLVQQYNLETMEIVEPDDLYHIERCLKINLQDYKGPLKFSVKGLTFYKNGIRHKWINPEHEYVLSLKMNHNDKFLNYIDLRKKRLLNEYLKYFPEDSYQFEEYQRKFYLIKNHLYECYVNHFIRKELDLKEINYSLKPHLFKLHEFYKKEGIKINVKIVSDYLHSLDGKQIMFICNYLF